MKSFVIISLFFSFILLESESLLGYPQTNTESVGLWSVVSSSAFIISAISLNHVPGFPLANSRLIYETTFLRRIWRLQLYILGLSTAIYHITAFRIIGILDELAVWMSILWGLYSFGQQYDNYTHQNWNTQWRITCFSISVIFIIFKNQIGILLHIPIPYITYIYAKHIYYEVPAHIRNVFFTFVTCTLLSYSLSCGGISYFYLIWRIGFAGTLYQWVKIHCFFIAKLMTRRGRSPPPIHRNIT